MKYIKDMKSFRFTLILYISFLFFPLSVFGQEGDMKEAESAYNGGDYEKAISIYEGVLKNYGESPEVYYNLGNAYYKSNKIAPAILYYEKALVLHPEDKDTRFNLQIAKGKTVDKIEPIGEFFLSKWFKSVQNTANIDTWGILGISSFLFLIVCLSLFFFSPKILIKKISFYVGILSIIILIFSNVFASAQKDEMENRSSAIVFAATVTVKSSPDESGTDLFVLHEGTKVSIKSTLGEWSEIELEDGNVGWLQSKNIEKI